MKICFDFDGVIHSFISPWVTDDVILDKPTKGCKKSLDSIKKLGATIYIHSTRCHCQKGRNAITKYMTKYGLTFDEVVEHKPVADIYVDNRAVLFNNSWSEVIKIISNIDQDGREVTYKKLNEIFKEELEETDQWGAEDGQIELKNEPLYHKVRSISNTHDLMGLIEMGDYEIKNISLSKKKLM